LYKNRREFITFCIHSVGIGIFSINTTGCSSEDRSNDLPAKQSKTKSTKTSIDKITETPRAKTYDKNIVIKRESISSLLDKTTTPISLAKRGVGIIVTDSEGSGDIFIFDAQLISQSDELYNYHGWIRTPQELDVLRAGAINSLDESSATKTTKAFKKLANYIDNKRANYLKIPNFNQNYFINETIVIQEPTMIKGTRSASYNRGKGKNGWIHTTNMGATGDDNHFNFFDLGNKRERDMKDFDVNPADQWVIDAIALKPKPNSDKDGDIFGTYVNGLLFTSLTDGPDRGIIIRNFSAKNLRSAIKTRTVADISTYLASVNIEDSVFRYCYNAVNFQGQIAGLKITNTQIEECFQTAITGIINGGVNISDNMLEGNKNTINIYTNPNGTSPKILVERNYLEHNRGDYFFNLTCTNPMSSVKIQDNYLWQLNTLEYIVLKGIMTAHTNDGEKVVLRDSTGLKLGSDIFQNNVMSYLVRFEHGNSNYIEIQDIDQFISYDESLYSIVSMDNINDSKSLLTPFGMQRCVELTGNSSLINLNIDVKKDDVLGLNMLLKIDGTKHSDTQIEILNGSGDIIATGITTQQTYHGKGVWHTLSINIPIKSAGHAFLRLNTSNNSPATVTLASIGSRNYGTLTNEIGKATEIFPITPFPWK
jgi:hypothetical protein